MNFYEINEPYFALIKASDETEAAERYIEEVVGEEEDFEEVRESFKEVAEDYVATMLLSSLNDQSGNPISDSELDRVLNDDITQVLLVDGALI